MKPVGAGSPHSTPAAAAAAILFLSTRAISARGGRRQHTGPLRGRSQRVELPAFASDWTPRRESARASANRPVTPEAEVGAAGSTASARKAEVERAWEEVEPGELLQWLPRTPISACQRGRSSRRSRGTFPSASSKVSRHFIYLFLYLGTPSSSAPRASRSPPILGGCQRPLSGCSFPFPSPPPTSDPGPHPVLRLPSESS